MTHPFGTNNPGIGGLDELTSAEEAIVAAIASLGSTGQVLAVDGAGTGVEWTSVAGTGDVTAGANFGTDNVLIRSDGTTKGVQSSGISIDDSDNMSGVNTLTVPEVAAPSTPASGNVVIYAKTDGKLYIKDDTGAETDLTSGGGGGASELSDLSDVADSTATNRFVLVADGTDFHARALTEADISDLGTYLSNIVADTTPQLGGNLDVNGNKIVSTSNGNIDIEPDGTGNVLLGNFTFDADQSVGAGQDNYVLTYDHSTGLISLEAASGGGGLNDVVDDTTPQLGGNLDVNGNEITSTSNGDIVINPNGSGEVQFGSDITGTDTNAPDIRFNSNGRLTLTPNASGTEAQVLFSGFTQNTYWDDGSFYGDNQTEVLKITDVASGVNYIDLSNAATSSSPIIAAAGSDSNVSIILRPKGTGKIHFDGSTDVYLSDNIFEGPNQNNVLGLTDSGSSVNYVTIRAAITANGPQIEAAGTDTNIDLELVPKGTGSVTSSGQLDMQDNSIGFTMQTATGDGTTTIDWKNGNHFDFTFGAFNETFTFTAPTKPAVLTLSLKQDSVGSRTATWPGTVKWPGGTAPTLTTTATTGYDIITFRFDGTNYYGGSLTDFS